MSEVSNTPSVPTWICPQHQIYYAAHGVCPACKKAAEPDHLRRIADALERIAEGQARGL